MCYYMCVINLYDITSVTYIYLMIYMNDMRAHCCYQFDALQFKVVSASKAPREYSLHYSIFYKQEENLVIRLLLGNAHAECIAHRVAATLM
jgi:hypothetical protein